MKQWQKLTISATYFHSDPFFVTRVNKPTKSLSLSYSYNNSDYKLKVDGFNINANLFNGRIIKVENGNSVSIEMINWMLPGNGIVIATIPKEHPASMKIVQVATTQPPNSPNPNIIDNQQDIA